MKQTNAKPMIIILILILAVLSVDLYLRYKKDSNPDYSILNLQDDPLSLTGFVSVDISTTNDAMILTKDCKSLAMSTYDFQVYSIQQGLDDKIDARPLTHDVANAILSNYNIKVMMVKISEYESGLYKANLFLKQNDQILNIESRPSDAIAIAVRQNSPIYIKKDILDKQAQDSC